MDPVSPREIVSKIHEIGSLPQSLAAVLKVLNEPKSGADEIADVISTDVSLTGRVLKMVNSAQYGRSGKVTKISEAVIVMGLNSIRMLTLSSSVFGMLPDKSLSDKFDIRRIWRHLIETATAARSIAEATKYAEPEEAFVAGIMHDVGMIIMLMYYKDSYIDLIARARDKNLDLLDQEEEAFGLTHTQVGRELIEHWKLPSSLAWVAGNHHAAENESDSPDDTRLNNIIALADRLSLGPYNEYYPNIEENIHFIHSTCEKLGLNSEMTNRIRKTSLIQSIKLAEYLDLDIGNVVEILTEAHEQLAELYYSVETLFIVKDKLFGDMAMVHKKKMQESL